MAADFTPGSARNPIQNLPLHYHHFWIRVVARPAATKPGSSPGGRAEIPHPDVQQSVQTFPQQARARQQHHRHRQFKNHHVGSQMAPERTPMRCGHLPPAQPATCPNGNRTIGVSENRHRRKQSNRCGETSAHGRSVPRSCRNGNRYIMSIGNHPHKNVDGRRRAQQFPPRCPPQPAATLP